MTKVTGFRQPNEGDLPKAASKQAAPEKVLNNWNRYKKILDPQKSGMTEFFHKIMHR